MKLSLSLFLPILAVTLLPTCAKAVVLVDQHPAVTTSGFNSNLPAVDSDQQIADDFTLSSLADIEIVEWSGYFVNDSLPGTTSSVDFIVRFFSGAPATTPLFSENVSATFVQTGTHSQIGDPLYRFSASLSSPLQLLGNTTFWLSVLDTDADTTTNFRWLESTNTFNSESAFRNGEGSAWIADDKDFAFTLSGTLIPEPSTLSLGSLGLLVAAYRLRKRA